MFLLFKVGVHPGMMSMSPVPWMAWGGGGEMAMAVPRVHRFILVLVIGGRAYIIP